jgi:hypothetical protein
VPHWHHDGHITAGAVHGHIRPHAHPDPATHCLSSAAPLRLTPQHRLDRHEPTPTRNAHARQLALRRAGQPDRLLALPLARGHLGEHQPQLANKTSLLLCYALGKAQRILAGLAALHPEPGPDIPPVVVHGAVDRITNVYRAANIPMLATRTIGDTARTADWRGALILAPPSAHNSPWTRRFKQVSTAFASGWMRVRGQRRRRALDRGFALSDHADWPALLTAIAATGAEHILVTHGQAAPLARYLNEQGNHAEVLATRFVGDSAEDVELPHESPPAEAAPA